MFDEPDFVQAYIDRWFELRQNELSQENLHATIDAHAARIAEAAQRDYSRWSGSRYGNFAGEIQHLKNWLDARTSWIDAKWLSARASASLGHAVRYRLATSSEWKQAVQAGKGTSRRGLNCRFH